VWRALQQRQQVPMQPRQQSAQQGQLKQGQQQQQQPLLLGCLTGTAASAM
jgi:hypothetical protein